MFEDFCVTKISIDYALELNLQLDERHALIRFENFHIAGTTANADSPETLVPLLALLHQSVRMVEINDTGELKLIFAHATIFIEADPIYEAWEIVSESKERWISQPGGRVAHWRPECEDETK